MTCSTAAQTAAPVPADKLRAAITGRAADFRAARYDRVPAALPKLIAAAQATSDNAGKRRAGRGQRAARRRLHPRRRLRGQGQRRPAVLDDLRPRGASRAGQAMTRSPSPTPAGRSPPPCAGRRAPRQGLSTCSSAPAATSSRPGTPARTSSPRTATCSTSPPTPPPPAGNRHAAGEYIAEAASAAARLGRTASSSQPAFGPAGVTLFQVSIAQVLGDSGTAIEHARTLRARRASPPRAPGPLLGRRRPRLPPVGQARSLLQSPARRRAAAPAEVRYRPPVHRMTEDLLRSPRSSAMPGLLAFAGRTGLPGA